MFRHSVVKLVLVLQGLALAALVALALSWAVAEWRVYRDALRIVHLTSADRTLFEASNAIRFEVGTHGVALLSMDDPKARIDQSSRKVDAAYDRVRAAVLSTDIPERDDLLADMDDAFTMEKRQRAMVREAMDLPMDQRDVATIEPWRQAIYGLARRFTDASVALGNTLRMLDPTVAELVQIRRASYAIRDSYGKPCSEFRREVQRNQPLSREAIGVWRQDVGVYLARWQDLDEALRRIGAPEVLVRDVAEGKAKTAEIQKWMDDILYNLDGSPYPAMPAAEWSGMCVSAYGSILKVGYDALDLAVVHAQDRQSEAMAKLSGAIAVLALVVVLGVLSVLIGRCRLSVPMRGLVGEIARLSRRQYDHPVAQPPYPDEVGAMAGALEELRQGALEADRLQKRLDEAREAQIERASQASRAKSAFLATMSHEVRTPLNGILGMVQLLQDSQLSAQQRQWLDAVSNSGTLLLAILNDILDYSKIEAGRMELEYIAFSLGELVETISSSMTPQAAARHLFFHTSLAGDLPERVRGDPAKISQILLNLVGNAIKFTSSGQVSLTVQGIDPPPRDGWVRVQFEVADTGIGIAPEAVKRLFEAFAQSDSSITRRFGGTGLGLAICKRIIEAMGGTIAVDSTVGQGSTFTVVMDLPQAHARSAEPDDAADPVAVPPLAILLADDNEVNATVATAMLEQMGHCVTVATDGAAAAALAAEHDYDLVMMDLAMPRLDGVSATRAIRDLSHATRSQVPVIALTATVSQDRIADCFAAGMNGFLGKPFRRAELARAVAEAIGIGGVDAPDMPHSLADPDGALLRERLHDLGAERAGRIVSVFVETTPSLVADLAAAAKAQDAARARDYAHRLKSASGNVGLGRLAELAAEAERAAERGDDGDLGHLIRRISEKAPQDIAALQALWAEIVSSPVPRTHNRPHVP